MNARNFAVIFDMDGVIVDNDEYHFRAWGELCTRYGLHVSQEEVKSWFGNTNSMILKNLFGNSIEEEKIIRLGAEKERLYRDLYTPDIQLTPGLVPFLENLNESGITVAIATSAPSDNVDFVMYHTGIRRYFHRIIDASIIREGKPSPEIYLKAAEVLEFPVSDCLVFEDSFHGIESARRAGMKVIGVATTHPADVLKGTVKNIHDFSEINALKIIDILINN